MRDGNREVREACCSELDPPCQTCYTHTNTANPCWSEFVCFISSRWYKYPHPPTSLKTHQMKSAVLTEELAARPRSAPPPTRCVVLLYAHTYTHRHGAKVWAQFKRLSPWCRSYLAWPVWEEASTFVGAGDKTRRDALCVISLQSGSLLPMRKLTQAAEKLWRACAKSNLRRTCCLSVYLLRYMTSCT